MLIEPYTREFFHCPHCNGGEFSAAHIERGGGFGPWYCDDCGGSFVGRRTTSGAIDLELRTERKIETINVLRLPPQSEAVYFVVEGMRFENGREVRDDQHDAQFYYEEHSCPVNWLRPTMVYCAGDADPHGLIQFVRSVDASSLPPDEPVGPNDHDRALVQLIEASHG